MQSISTRFGTVAYERSGSGTPLILLSANPGDHRDFAAVLPELVRRFDVIALDWPGYGQSPAPNPPASASAMLYADLLREFVTALKLPPVLLVGNSVGGFASVRLAIDRPELVRGMVLVSPGGFTPHNFVSRLFCRIKGSAWVTRLTNVAFAKFYLRLRSPTVKEMLARAGGEQGTPAAIAVNAAIWRSFGSPEHDLRQRAARVKAPTLVVSGRYDQVIPANKDGRIAAQSIPGAQQIVLATGHAPFAEDPAAFLAAVNPFLARIMGHA